MLETDEKVYRAICIFIDMNGYPPSHSDIIEMTGVRNVQKPLSRLQKQGLIKTIPFKFRGIMLTNNEVLNG